MNRGGVNPRILVVRGGALGDFILTLPAIAALRQKWPLARIEILGHPHIAELALDSGLADAVRSIEARGLASFFVTAGHLDADWRQYLASFDLVVSYLYDPDQVFADNLRRCGVRQLVQGDPQPRQLAAAVHYCEPLRALGIQPTDPLPRLQPSAKARERAMQLLGADWGQFWCAVHPGSGSERKNWPVPKFVAVLDWLRQASPVRLLVLQGEADAKPVGELLATLAPPPVLLVCGQTLSTVAALLQRCRLYLGNDSGITHLAAAVGTPTIGLFGPASTPLWQPRAPQAQVVAFGEGDVENVRALAAALVPSRCGASHLP